MLGRKNFRSSVDTAEPEEWLNSCDTHSLPTVVFLCTPPELTQDIFFQWLSAFASRFPQREVQFVFCNNGILTPQTLAAIALKQAQQVNLSFIRALFFVGSLRSKEAKKVEVQWTGGRRVIWDFLSHGSQHAFELMQNWLGKDFAAESTQVDQLGFMEWQHEGEITRIEREKFFTNFMLAAGIGPNLAKNKTLSQVISEREVAELAEQFADLWQAHRIERDALIQMLRTTVNATSENINSLSYSGAFGNSATMAWFLSTLTEDIRHSTRAEKHLQLTQFLNSVRLKWGMPNEH